METFLVLTDEILFSSFNFLASLINGNKTSQIDNKNKQPTFNFLASLINGNVLSRSWTSVSIVSF